MCLKEDLRARLKNMSNFPMGMEGGDISFVCGEIGCTAKANVSVSSGSSESEPTVVVSFHGPCNKEIPKNR